MSLNLKKWKNYVILSLMISFSFSSHNSTTQVGELFDQVVTWQLRIKRWSSGKPMGRSRYFPISFLPQKLLNNYYIKIFQIRFIQKHVLMILIYVKFPIYIILLTLWIKFLVRSLLRKMGFYISIYVKGKKLLPHSQDSKSK